MRDSDSISPAVLRLEGEIDLARRSPLMVDIKSRLRVQRQLIIDLSAVTFIDCSGLGTLVWARNRARDVGGDLALVGPCPALSRILVLTSLDEHVPLFPDVRTAADALGAATPAVRGPRLRSDR